MPVLPEEPAVFPEDLFQETDGPVIADRRWHVLHTKPRQEKSLARELFRARIPFYLPLIARRFASRGRVLTSYVPLFPGYGFVLSDDGERLDVLATRRIAQWLEVPDQQQLWHDLAQVQQLIVAGVPLTPEDRWGPGTKIRIRRGSLAGLEGTIVRSASGHRFVVQVNFIQQGASVLLDDAMLEEL